MIRLNSLRLVNFFSHVDTNLDLKEYEGLVLIEGQNEDGHYSSNGSGKSTLLEGILYAFTGNTLRGTSVNDIVNRNHKKNTHVTLEFDKGVPYSISRYRKDDTHGDHLFFSQGDTDLSKRVNKETQKYIEDTVGISQKILVSTMLLGEGLSSRFTQLSDAEKKSLLESTLNLDYDIQKLRSNVRQSMTTLELEKATIKGKLSALSSISRKSPDEIRKFIKENQNTVVDLKSEYESLTTAYESMERERDTLDSKITLVLETIKSIDSQTQELERLKAEYTGYAQELEQSQSSPNPICTVCHQPLLTDTSKEYYQQTYMSKLKDLHTNIVSVSSKLDTLPSKDVLSVKYESLNSERESLTKRIHDSKMQSNTAWQKYVYLENTINQYKEELENYTEDLDEEFLVKEVKTIEDKLARYEYFYDLFSPTGILTYILTDAISYINMRLSKYSEVLLDKSYQLSLVKGKLSLTESNGASYQSLSSGEKKRLDLSIQFSLHDYVHKYCNLSMDTLFIDEVMDALDDIGIENIITVLRMKLEYCDLSRILVISHNPELKSYFDHVITVKKDLRGDSHLI